MLGAEEVLECLRGVTRASEAVLDCFGAGATRASEEVLGATRA